MIGSYKDLIVWQKSIDLAELVYQVTEILPSTENIALKPQIIRAAVLYLRISLIDMEDNQPVVINNFF